MGLQRQRRTAVDLQRQRRTKHLWGVTNASVAGRTFIRSQPLSPSSSVPERATLQDTGHAVGESAKLLDSQASGVSLQGFLRAIANMYYELEHDYSCLNHLQIAGDYLSSPQHLPFRRL